jgi:hypothetical protein
MGDEVHGVIEMHDGSLNARDVLCGVPRDQGRRIAMRHTPIRVRSCVCMRAWIGPAQQAPEATVDARPEGLLLAHGLNLNPVSRLSLR